MGSCLSAMFVKPMMAFMGVRMSWDMLFRKVLLAELADSASRRSRFSSLFVSCSSRTFSELRWTLTKLIAASSSSSANADMKMVSMRTVESIMLMVLTATASAGIRSIRIML